MIWFTKEDIIDLHNLLIEKKGGLTGIRDENMLESAINSPFQTFDGQDFYPSPIDKIIRLSYNLATLHTFFDGNKRISALTLMLGLQYNGYKLVAEKQIIIDKFWDLGAGKVNYYELNEWVYKNIQKI